MNNLETVLTDEEIAHFQREHCVYPGTTRKIEQAVLAKLAQRDAQSGEIEPCAHEWVSADNQYVNGCSICTKCGKIIATSDTMKQAEQRQEPVARVVKDGATVRLEWTSADAAHNAKPGPLYTAPQALPWVGLTNGEIDALWIATPEDQDGNDFVPFARAIESLLRSKNAGGVK